MNLNYIKSATERLNAMFSSVVKMKFNQFVSEDGTMYQYSVIEEGAEVYEATADGSEPAGDGEYVIDGVNVVVKDGKIESFSTPEAEEVVMEEQEEEDVKEEISEEQEGEQEVDLEEEYAAVANVIENFESILSQLSEALSRIETLESTVKAKEGEFKMLEEAFSKFSQTPKKSRTDLKSVLSNTSTNRIESIQNAFGKAQ